MAGYGLYLLRLPITLMPGPDSREGKGAVVTVEARHDLTDDLLEGTLRNVVLMDLVLPLTQIINENAHEYLCNQCMAARAGHPMNEHRVVANEYQVVLTHSIAESPNRTNPPQGLILVAKQNNGLLDFRVFDSFGTKSDYPNVNGAVFPQGLMKTLVDVTNQGSEITLPWQEGLKFIACMKANIQNVPNISILDCDETPFELMRAWQNTPAQRLQANSGPRPSFPADLRIILGHVDWPYYPCKEKEIIPPKPKEEEKVSAANTERTPALRNEILRTSLMLQQNEAQMGLMS